MLFVDALMRKLSISEESRRTPKLWADLTNCGHISSTKGEHILVANSLKCFLLQTSITSVLLRYTFKQLFFIHELISSKDWAILVVVVWLYMKDRKSCVSSAILLALESMLSDQFT